MAAVWYALGLIAGFFIGMSVGVLLERRSAHLLEEPFSVEPPPSSVGGIDRTPSPWWKS